jgi:putative ABC transport system permease protein
VLAAAGVITLLTGLAIGLLPALAIRPGQLGAQSRGGRGQIGAERGWLRTTLVAGEIALALTVLVGAALAVGSLLEMQRVDAGIRETNLFVGRLAIPEARYREPASVDAFYDQVIQRVAAIPGVASAAVSMSMPPHRLVMTNPYTPQVAVTFASVLALPEEVGRERPGMG